MRTPRNTGACRQQTARQENYLHWQHRRGLRNVQLPLGQGANHAGLRVPGAFVMRPVMQRAARRQTAKSQQQDGQKAGHQRLRPKAVRFPFPLHRASSKQDQRQRQAWIWMKCQPGSISFCCQFAGLRPGRFQPPGPLGNWQACSPASSPAHGQRRFNRTLPSPNSAAWATTRKSAPPFCEFRKRASSNLKLADFQRLSPARGMFSLGL